jgi:hypothetical protein
MPNQCHTTAVEGPFCIDLKSLNVHVAQVIWNYVSVFFSSSWTLAERAEAASFVLHFLRLWRSWLLRAERLTLKANFISRECYEDITISVHNVILIIRCPSFFC